MSDPNIIIQAISTVGFPIVSAIALFWYVYKLNESHKDETTAMRESINQNTVVLSELKELISVIVKGGRDV